MFIKRYYLDTAGTGTDVIMDIDSQDDALLLEAAKQFDCAER